MTVAKPGKELKCRFCDVVIPPKKGKPDFSEMSGHVFDKHKKKYEEIQRVLDEKQRKEPENLAKYSPPLRGRASIGGEFRSRLGYGPRSGGSPDYDKDK
jgi:hypothetical protein